MYLVPFATSDRSFYVYQDRSTTEVYATVWMAPDGQWILTGGRRTPWLHVAVANGRVADWLARQYGEL